MDKKLDLVIPIASSIHSSKGVYALLLGSGISRSAKILTGYEITGELIKRIALTQGADVGIDPHSWYVKTFERQPKYDDLLAKLAPSPDDRHMLLRPYFEPNDADRSSGDKRPTVAHKAIARLVKKGFIKVIVTTNFDHLLEQALESEGVAFTVVYTDNMVSGMLPLVHGGVIIIKVNGDYTDPRLRNTEDELTRYGIEMSTLLSRVFDEYGLIVCGWSAEWDKGLCELIQKSPNRRFSSFWTSVDAPDSVLKRLIENRQGNLITIKDADSFFSSIEEKVMALDSLTSRNPLPSKLAAESVKLYLPDPSQSIRLQELIQNEAIRVRDLLSEYNVSVAQTHGGADELIRRVNFYEDTVDTMMQILIVGARYGSQEHRVLWRKAFEVIGSSLTRVIPSISVRSLTLQLYPLAYLFYGFGITSLLGEREYNLLEILRRWKFELNVGRPRTAHALNNVTFSQKDGTGLLDEWPKAPNGQKYFMPFSEFILGRLREPLGGVASSPQKYEDAFDQFELLIGLDAKFIGSPEYVNGRYTYKLARTYDIQFFNDFQEEVKQAGGARILQAGFFDGNLSNFEEQIKKQLENIAQLRGYYF